jgi:hypothetical protein
VHHLSGSGLATCQCWWPIRNKPILTRNSILGAGLFVEKDMFWGKTYF